MTRDPLMRLLVNRRAARAPIGQAGFIAPGEDPFAFHRRLPGYSPTPLIEARVLARELGVRRVLVKDEAHRFGLPSFKVLGAAWAIYQEIIRRVTPQLGAWDTVTDLVGLLSAHPPLKLAAATDGNHGRAVAWMARLLGWPADIYVPAGTTRARIDAIAAEHARVTVVNGSYDDAVTRAAADAGPGTLVISDTSWPGYEQVPRWVIAGYSTMYREVDDQLAAKRWEPPTVIAVQMGVGALAAATVLHYRNGTHRPSIIGVEPRGAACVLASLAAGTPVQVPGPHRSIMAGLNCGSPSLVAWPVLRKGLDAAVAVDDEHARHAMRLLAGAGIVAGESGAAGFAGLLAMTHGNRDGCCGRLGLTPEATVLIIATEGATDPASYRQIVGRARRR
jgi:diaminopropionate ammonia-lyase